jgi:tRNA/rRNA methyltransferase
MSLNNCRVVLVGTTIAANIGSVARVMRNMGVSDLVLVAPQAEKLDPRADLLATNHAIEILHSARIVPDLGTALADCLVVAATSARVGGLFRVQSVGTPEDILPRLTILLPSGPVALVFGPESSGLTNEEIARAHCLIHIPTDPDYSALNLAQSVAICLYTLRRLWLQEQGQLPKTDLPASFEEQERMFAHLRASLKELHFLYGDKADALMHALRHLIVRAGPTAMEVKLFHGLARQIEWYVREHGS